MMITKHAERRINQRLFKKGEKSDHIKHVKSHGWSKDMFSRKSAFRKYINHQQEKHNCEILIYGHFVYAFAKDGTLKTVMPVPNKFIKFLDDSQVARQ